MKQFQLIRICDQSHSNLAEALCSVLASSYHNKGGVNGKLAGAIGELDLGDPNDPTTLTASGFRENIIKLLDKTEPPSAYFRGKGFNDERMERLKGWIEAEEESWKALSERADEKQKETSDRYEELLDKFEILDLVGVRMSLQDRIADVESMKINAAVYPLPAPESRVLFAGGAKIEDDSADEMEE
jgi:hypothetical protein